MTARKIGTATVDVNADISGFRSGLDGIQGVASSAFSKLSGVIAGLGLGRIAREAIDFGAEYRTQLDNASAAVHGLVGNQQDADDLLHRMTAFAIATPFSLPGVQDSVAQLLAVGKGFGVTSDNAIAYARTIGNVTAITGGSDETMTRITRTLGQMSSSGQVLGRNMNALAQNIPGLDVWGELAEGAGVSVEELRKLQREGKLDELLTGNQAVDILLKSMEEFPGAGKDAATGLDAMDRKMATFGGTMEVFKDTMGVALAEGLTPFFSSFQKLLRDPAIQKGLSALATAFGVLVAAIMDELGPLLPDLIDAFVEIVKALVPAAPAITVLVIAFADMLVILAPLIKLLATVIGWIGQLLAKLDPTYLGIIALALVAFWLALAGPEVIIVVAIIAAAVATIGKLLSSLGVSFSDVTAVISAAWDWLFKNVIERVMGWVEAIIGFFQHLYDILVGNSIIPDLVNAIVGFFTGMIDTLVGIVQALINAIVAIWDTLWGLIEPILNLVKTYLNLHWEAIKLATALAWEAIKLFIIKPIELARAGVEVAVGLISSVVSTTWDTLKGAVQTAWNLIKDFILDPINAVNNTIGRIISGISSAVTGPFDKLGGLVTTAFNAVKDGILGPLEAAADAVKGIVDRITAPIKGIGGALGNIGSFVGGLFASGGIITQPTVGILGEHSLPEVVIPLTNQRRAMELMRQTGLDRLGSGPSASGAPVGFVIENATFQNATDADLVAQRTLVAMQAALIPV